MGYIQVVYSDDSLV